MRLLTFMFVVPMVLPVLVRADDGAKDPPQDGPTRQIVFICDASESFQNLMPTLKHELAGAITGLRPVQSFNIVLCQDGKAIPFRSNILPASPQAKRDAIAWLNDKSAKGRCDPVPALEITFKLKPQLVYLLVGAGGVADGKGIVETIDRLNKNRKTKVYTFLFMKDASEKKQGEAVEPFLKQIAEDNGGRFRSVEADAIEDPTAPGKRAPATQPVSPGK